MWYVLDVLETDGAECCREVESGEKSANPRSLQLECAKGLHEAFREPIQTDNGVEREG